MRIRSLRPEFWRSEDIEQLTWHQRLVFIGLWSYVDDNGVGRDRVSDIAADLFSADLSRDPSETLGRVSGSLEALSDAGLITRYTDGKALLFVTGWDKHQRIDNPSKSQRYSRPTCGYGDSRESLATVSLVPSETTPTGEGEKGRRGEGEKGEAAALPDAPRPDVDALCDYLADQVATNTDRRPTITKKWRDSARLLLDKDKRTEDQVRHVIAFATTDSFWKGNVQSMPTLREKFDRLIVQAREAYRQGRAVTSPDGQVDPDVVLGPDVWTPPPPPADVERGSDAEREWFTTQREQRRQARIAEARRRAA